MKKIAVITCVKNECDIIESFCRYSAEFCDVILIHENHKSDDGTREIIQKLIDEGLPVFFEAEGKEIYYEDAKGILAKTAVDKYKADLVLQLDADEFLYHKDGTNPRETLEDLREDTEYQILWQTFVYLEEPGGGSRFIPDNFTHFRRSEFEEAMGHAGKAIASRYLLMEKKAAFVHGAHWLEYPDEHRAAAKTVTMQELLCAHYPVRSRAQVMIKSIPNWINKWTLPEEKRVPREVLSEFQLGILFDDIKKHGDASTRIMTQASIKYSLFSIGDRDKIETLLSLPENEQIYEGKINTAFIDGRLQMQYSDAQRSGEAFIRATLSVLDAALQNLDSESRPKTHKIKELAQQLGEVTKQFDDLTEHHKEWAEHHNQLSEHHNQLSRQYNELIKHIGSLTQYIHGIENRYLTSLNEKNAAIANALHEINVRNAQISNLEGLLAEHKNAFWWRATKPMRAATGAMRKLLGGAQGRGAAVTGMSGTAQGAMTEESSPPAGAAGEDIKFSIISPVFNINEKHLKQMLESVLSQSYGNWELCLINASDANHSYVDAVCKTYAGKDSRIRYKKLEENKGISANSNEALAIAAGDYIALLDHDDTITADALQKYAAAIKETGALVLYCDEDHIAPDGEYRFPLYKPDWSPDLLYCQNYICHMLVFSRKLIEHTGGFDPAFDGAQDYDLILRFSEVTNRIYHIPGILYHWRDSEVSTSQNPLSKPYAQNAGLQALNAHLGRIYANGFAEAYESDITYVYDVRYNTLAGNPLISVIIPIKDKQEMTQRCVQSILDKTGYKNYEIIILNNRSEEAATIAWLQEIEKKDPRIRVEEAGFEFNWSKINNFGMEKALGEVYVFLNNDTLVISPDWLERLAENALREDIGAVCPLLLFEDDTVQHAGVVVGMGGYADHLFKAQKPEHWGTPYCSMMVSRNVLAVTGACMAVSKYTIDKTGPFDERFIICGSDVEFCLRAYEAGLSNLYVAFTRLYHFESKSRDSYIPAVDFEMSDAVYAPYRKNGDPYFNINLDLYSTAPAAASKPQDTDRYANYKMRTQSGRKELDRTAGSGGNNEGNYMPVEVSEVTPPYLARGSAADNALRINIIIPSVNRDDVYGGIATALDFFYEMVRVSKARSRIIVVSSAVDKENCVIPPEYVISGSMDPDIYDKQLLDYTGGAGMTIPVSGGDVFIATAWWTAYNLTHILGWQASQYGQMNCNMIYFIQDYEPGFYPWSTRYLMAESTYKNDCRKIAVINSAQLYDYFKANNYRFDYSFYFEPTLNKMLLSYLNRNKAGAKKKKRVIIYGRPVTYRNGFELLVLALRQWCLIREDIGEWEILSLGERHADVALEKGKVLHSLGKVSLEEYAGIMLGTYMAASLMVSPHPSYPPLEMAAFGVKVITNKFANKDLSSFSSNIISLESCDEDTICGKLEELASGFTDAAQFDAPGSYLTDSSDKFGGICGEIAAIVLENGEDGE